MMACRGRVKHKLGQLKCCCSLCPMTIPAETVAFLTALYRRSSGYLTLSAVHPEQSSPSRHLPLRDIPAIEQSLSDLLVNNRRGWHALYSVATRRADLGRWKRGGVADLHQLPALFADIDRPPDDVLPRLRDSDPPPSAVVLSGRGVHAYWWLEQPTADWSRANAALRRLAQQFDGDRAQVAGALRLPGSLNPKRDAGRCVLHTLNDHVYALEDLSVANPPEARSSSRLAGGETLNPRLLDVVSVRLLANGGHLKSNGWIDAYCPCGHQHDRPGKHFAFNPRIGVGVCLGRHGRMLLKDVCEHLNIDPHDHGGIYQTTHS